MHVKTNQKCHFLKKETPKSRLDTTQFIRYVKKQNQMETIVFVAFPAHPTTDPGIVHSPKPTKNHTLELTLKNDNLKPGRNEQAAKNRPQINE